MTDAAATSTNAGLISIQECVVALGKSPYLLVKVLAYLDKDHHEKLLSAELIPTKDTDNHLDYATHQTLLDSCCTGETLEKWLFRRERIVVCRVHGDIKTQQSCIECGGKLWTCRSSTASVLGNDVARTSFVGRSGDDEQKLLRMELDCLQDDGGRCAICNAALCTDCAHPRECVSCGCTQFCYSGCADEACPCLPLYLGMTS